jgi:hypothetical protein
MSSILIVCNALKFHRSFMACKEFGISSREALDANWQTLQGYFRRTVATGGLLYDLSAAIYIGIT